MTETVLLKPTEESWLRISEEFHNKWQLPHCVGAIDGKHVVVQAPAKSGSTFYNYKGSFSIVLMAMCDANYRFTLVDIGAEGRHSDGGIFKHSQMGQLINTNAMHFPAPSPLFNEIPVHYYLAADEAFPLTMNIMRPYAGRFLTQEKRIFNYRLCRARRVIENVFGILAARWRIYQKPIVACQSTVVAIVKATVCLHNYLINAKMDLETEKQYFSTSSIDREDESGQITEGEWRKESSSNLLPIRRTSSNMYCRSAEQMRSNLMTYFMTDGAVPFQWNR